MTGEIILSLGPHNNVHVYVYVSIIFETTSIFGELNCAALLNILCLPLSTMYIATNYNVYALNYTMYVYMYMYLVKTCEEYVCWLAVWSKRAPITDRSDWWDYLVHSYSSHSNGCMYTVTTLYMYVYA